MNGKLYHRIFRRRDLSLYYYALNFVVGGMHVAGAGRDSSEGLIIITTRAPACMPRLRIDRGVIWTGHVSN